MKRPLIRPLTLGAAAPAASPAKKSPIGKLLLGCGCLVLVILAIIGVALAMMVYAAKEKAAETFGDDYSISEAIEVAVAGASNFETPTPSTTGIASGDDKGGGGATAKADGPSREKTDLSAAKVRAELEKPLSQKDADRVFAVYDGLKKTDAYEQWHTSLAGMTGGDKKGGGTIERMKQMRHGMKGFDAYRDLFEAYEQLVKDNGGYEAYLGSLVRISGAAAASKQIARDKKLDAPEATAVAGHVLAARPAIKKELEQSVAEATKVAKKNAGKEGMNPALLGVLQEPGTIAMGRMPEASFKTWAAWPQAQRKRIIELPTQGAKDFPGMLIGVTWSGEPLIVSSELQRIVGEK